jgi:anti-sigma factor RsiW
MNGSHSGKAPHLGCAECQRQLQDHHDGTLPRRESMRMFLHLRDCEACQQELARLERLVTALESLPPRQPPEDFDQRILASVPLEQYRAMAALRAPRVPVFLEAEALPAWIRGRAPRLGGAAVAAAALGVRAADLAGDPALAIAGAGLLPSLAVALQAVARRVVVGLQQARQEG